MLWWSFCDSTRVILTNQFRISSSRLYTYTDRHNTPGLISWCRINDKRLFSYVLANYLFCHFLPKYLIRWLQNIVTRTTKNIEFPQSWTNSYLYRLHPSIFNVSSFDTTCAIVLGIGFYLLAHMLLSYSILNRCRLPSLCSVTFLASWRFNIRVSPTFLTIYTKNYKFPVSSYSLMEHIFKAVTRYARLKFNITQLLNEIPLRSGSACSRTLMTSW